jgi:hypothetical protein
MNHRNGPYEGKEHADPTHCFEPDPKARLASGYAPAPPPQSTRPAACIPE